MKQPKISAILPCYNHAAFLEERINSVLNQTLPVSQIIFLDDASTDGSLELAKKLLSDTPIEVEFRSNAYNSGSPFAQWNKGLRLAKHPYVWIAETDDICRPSLIEKLWSRMTSPNVVIAFAQSRYISESGADLGSVLTYTEAHWPGYFSHDLLASGDEFNSKFMSVINVIPNASAVLLNRSGYASRVQANESMNYCGDWDFWVRIASLGYVAFVAEELNGFRCHQQTTRNKHHTSQAAAEFFACRLRAQMPREGSNKELDLKKLIMHFTRDNRNNVTFALNSLAGSHFRKFYSSYRRLCSVPHVSNGAWVIIALIGFRVYLWRKIFNLGKYVVCLSKRLILSS